MGWRERLSACCIYLAAVPTAISASANIQFTSLSAGETLTCGVAMSGTLYCWGSDERILVGEGKSIDLPIPSVIAPEVGFNPSAWAILSFAASRRPDTSTAGDVPWRQTNQQ